MKAFKIKDATTGLYSTAGVVPRWTKIGKNWGRISALSNHLSYYISGQHPSNPKEIPESWMICELSEDGYKEYSAREYKQKQIDKKRK